MLSLVLTLRRVLRPEETYSHPDSSENERPQANSDGEKLQGVKLHMREGIELPYLDKIRMLREKEIYKYLGILKADIIK